MANAHEEFLNRLVDEARDDVFAALDFLWAHPETGYTEWVSNNYLKEKWQALGLSLVEAGDIPGFYADLDTGRPGPTIAVMGELDALDIANHPCSVNGMNHSCGHCAQGATMLGIATALSKPGALDGFSGKIRLMMVPAEEMIQLVFREKLRKEGKIHYFGGKQEFLYRGLFDGVDMALMAHTGIWKGDPKVKFTCTYGHNGIIAKSFTYHGKASHAGARPSSGVNAEYAAVLGLNACNALRETFPDEDHVRFHPISHGVQTSVNIIPDEVALESYVRASTYQAMKRENEKINRALTGAALSMGASITISDRPGYAPEYDDKSMMKLAEEAACDLFGEGSASFSYTAVSAGSSDFGDLTSLMPGLQFHASGATGTAHGIDYMIEDRENACINSAKLELAVLNRLLSSDAAKAREIIDQYDPLFKSVKEYTDYMDAFTKDLDPICYGEDGNVSIRLR